MPRFTPIAVAALKSITVVIRKDQRINDAEAVSEGRKIRGIGAGNQEPCPTW